MNINYKELIKQAHEYKKGKTCTSCKKYKLLSEYYKSKNFKDGVTSSCIVCSKKADGRRCRFKRWFMGVRTRARREGIEFNIEPTDIAGVKIKPVYYNDKKRRRVGLKPGVAGWKVTEYPKVCSKWGIELDWSKGKKVASFNSPSLDRINPTKGYTIGNVRLVCQSYNGAKLNCLPDEWDKVEKKIARSILFGVKND